MLRSLSFFLGAFIFLSVVGTAFAESSEPGSAAPLQNGAEAIITAPQDIAVGKTIILDASASQIKGERTEYRWSIDETRQTLDRGVEAIYTPEKPGILTFRLLIRSVGLDGKTIEREATHKVVAYRRKIVIIADSSVEKEKLEMHQEEGLAGGMYVKVLQTEPRTPSLMVEEALTRMLSEDKTALSGAEAIVVWTESIAGMQALMRSVESDTERLSAVHNQSIIFISDFSLKTIARTLRSASALLRPKELTVTRNEALNPLITAQTMEDFHHIMSSRDIDSLAVTPESYASRPWDILLSLVNYLLANGVPSEAVILLLMLPIIATIFSFLKQVIGITTFGLYTPSIVALSFLSLGWWIGLLFLVFILIMSHLTRVLMRRWRLLYIPKVAIILTVVSLMLLVLVAIGTAFDLTFSRDTIFILLILSTLGENFLQLKTEEGWWSAVLGVGETVLGSLLCVVVVQSATLQSILLAYPELLLLTILINAFLGKWTGLRVLEYFRFREVFKHLQEE